MDLRGKQGSYWGEVLESYENGVDFKVLLVVLFIARSFSLGVLLDLPRLLQLIRHQHLPSLHYVCHAETFKL